MDSGERRDYRKERGEAAAILDAAEPERGGRGKEREGKRERDPETRSRR